MSGIGSLSAQLLCAFAVLFTGCGCSSSCRQPAQGEVLLKHIGTSNSMGTFQLENRSSEGLWFYGTADGSGVVNALPPATTIECQHLDSKGWISEPPFVGTFLESAVVEVPPAAARRVTVHMGYALQHMQGVCRLRMNLNGGRFILSEAFALEPPAHP